MLKIQNLEAKIDNKSILKGLNLDIKPGEVHAIMGPNGSGKANLVAIRLDYICLQAGFQIVRLPWSRKPFGMSETQQFGAPLAGQAQISSFSLLDPYREMTSLGLWLARLRFPRLLNWILTEK